MGKKNQEKAVKTRIEEGKIVLVYGESQKSRFDIIPTFIGVIGIFMALITILVTIIIFILIHLWGR